MSDAEFLIYGYYLTGENPKKTLIWQDVIKKNLLNKSYWLHFDGNHDEVLDWLKTESSIDSFIVDAMTAKQTRARFIANDDGFLIILKAINQNPHASPEDMVSIRIYVEKNRIITLCMRKVLFLSNLEKKLLSEKTTLTPFNLLVLIANELFFNLEEVTETLDEEMDRIDDVMNTKKSLTSNLISTLSQIRSQTIILKSYLTPQKEVLHDLMGLQMPWLEKKTRTISLNFSEKISLYLESLDVIKERAVVALDEIRICNAEKSNRNSYIFSIVAVIFLPLGFLTGLFGINLAGIPGAEHPWAFTLFCLAILAISSNMLFFLKWIKWL